MPGPAAPQPRRVGEVVWELPRVGAMRVPGRIYADQAIMDGLGGADQSLTQVANVAQLPGIVRYALAMPDIHFGYGFPIGGVAAFRTEDGVVSPGGVGYDINCGVRLLATSLHRNEVQDALKRMVDQLFRDVPAGRGFPRGHPHPRARPTGAGAGRGRRVGRAGRVRPPGRPRAHGVRRRVAGRRPRLRERPRLRSGSRSGGHPRVGQPLPGSAGGGPGLRRRGGPDVRSLPGTDHGDDPLRQPRLRIPGLRRLPAGDGRSQPAPRHRPARPPIGVRPRPLARSAALPGRHGVCRQLRVGQPADDHALDRGSVAQGAGAGPGRPRPPAGLRRGPQHRQDRGAPGGGGGGRGRGGLRPPQGSHAGLRSGASGGAGALPLSGSTHPDPGGHGHGLVRVPGHGQGDGRDLRLLLPRRRPGDEPFAGPQAGQGPRRSTGSWPSGGSSSARRDARPWARRCRRPTRTWSAWSA